MLKYRWNAPVRGRRINLAIASVGVINICNEVSVNSLLCNKNNYKLDETFGAMLYCDYLPINSRDFIHKGIIPTSRKCERYTHHKTI